MNVKKIRAKYVHPLVSQQISKTNALIPTIIYCNGNCENIQEYILNAGGKIKYKLSIINAIAAEIPAESIDTVASHHKVQFIHHDLDVSKCMDNAYLAVSGQSINESSYTGKDIGIAILDTGVYPHDDLIKPLNRIIAFKDFINDKPYPYDGDGHGTHVAGIAAGNGYSNEKYKGIAPEANIIGVKVLNDSGRGSSSDILAGIQWVVDHKDEYNIKVINMSFGSPASTPYRNDPLAKGATEAVRQGLTVVTAAGNNGPSSSTISTPGTSPYVVTVGAIDDNRTSSYNDNIVAKFSGRGPTLDGLPKPDVVAPGVDIMSLSNKSHTGYKELSGTSMAAPMVAGTAALLYEKEQNLSPNRIKSRIKNTAVNIGESRFSEGSGVLNIQGALDLDSNKKNPRQQPSRKVRSPFRFPFGRRTQEQPRQEQPREIAAASTTSNNLSDTDFLLLLFVLLFIL